MVRKTTLLYKIPALLLLFVMVFNFTALPIYDLAEEIKSQTKTGASSLGMMLNSDSEPSLGQITIPTVEKNPYRPTVHKLFYPVMRSDRINYSDAFFHTIQSNTGSSEHSGYYSVSLASLLGYYYAGGYAGGQITQNNYYSGMRKNTLNPDVYAYGRKLGFIINTADASDYTNFISGTYVYDYLHLNKDHLSFQITAKQVNSNHAKLDVSVKKNDGKSYAYNKEMTRDGESAIITVPLADVIALSGSVDGYCYGGSAFTDVIAMLVDNTSPSVTNIEISQEMTENDQADLVMKMTFNEGIRFADLRDSSSTKYLDSMWVDVEIEELETGKLRTVRLYASEVGTDCTMTLRANIGRFHYFKYRVNRVSDVGFGESVNIRDYTVTAIDLAAEVEDGPDAALYSSSDASGIRYSASFNGKVTPITDVAGNSIYLDSIVDWHFGDQFNDPSFGIEEINIYNDKTLALAEGTYTQDDLNPEDLFIGSNTNMTVKIHLSRVLTEEQWKKISIKLNLIGPDGENVTLTPTRTTEYSRNYLYDNGTIKGSVLIFENVKLPKGTRHILEAGEDPVIKVTDVISKISELTFYPYYDDPIIDMRADFTSPTATARLVDSQQVGEGSEAYHTAMIELVLSDVVDYSKIAGLVGGDVTVSLGADVDKEVSFKYLLSTDPQPPENEAGYTGAGIISENGFARLGSMKILNDPQKVYLYIRIDQEDVYVGDLKLDISLTDAVGNFNDREEIPITLDYVIDKVAPLIKIESKTATATEQNTKIELDVKVFASDISEIMKIEYYVGDDPTSPEATWSPIVKNESGTDVSANLIREYGGLGAGENKVVNEMLWVRAYDNYGNVSDPISTFISLSLEKPSTNAILLTDGNEVRTDHSLIVTGPEKSALDGADAYTRVTITPKNSNDFAYVVIVKTGESVDIFDFENLSYYKVETGNNVDAVIFTSVSDPISYEQGESLDEHALRDIFTYYGELKVSFENGYGSMLPVVGEAAYSAANDGSYYKDPNYLTVRFASPYDEGRKVHSVHFGKVVSRTDEVFAESLVQTDMPVVIHQSEIGFGAMRNMQIHFSINNIASADFGYLDLDYKNSYAEFYLLSENGEEDVLMSSIQGLSASGNQYFTVGNTDDNGNLYSTGAYYLKVTVKSKSGHEDVFLSGKLVLDAQTADSAGVWEYSYFSPSNIYHVNDTESYAPVVVSRDPATEEYITDFGLAVMAGGETMRSRVFAVYSYGADSLTVNLSAPNVRKTVAGVDIGKISGFKIWNILSAPTNEQIANAKYELNYGSDILSLYNNLTEIYDKDSIPKGEEAIGELHLVKGVNIFCYQAKLENGYETPIKYFTVTVTDKAPTLNVAIDDYIPSHEPSSVSGVVNVDSIRMFIETAYSFNGSGKVDVQLWSTYAMNLGLYGEDGEISERFFETDENGESVYGILSVLKSGLREGEYAVITENSYTSDFPEYNTLCTSAFVAIDEYGGTTIIAPQIGNAQRHRVYGGVAGEHEYNICYYGDYYSDPYIIGDDGISWRVRYNEPSYNGNILLGFESYLVNNLGDEEVKVKVISTDDGSLARNLFNISSNDVYPRPPDTRVTTDERGVEVLMEDVVNANLISQLSTITLSGDGIDGEAIIPLFDTNEEYGYGGASIEYINGTYRLSFRFANPRADENNPVGTELNRKFKLTIDNGYGEVFSTPEYWIVDGVNNGPYFAGDFVLRYIEYAISDMEMTESGAKLKTNFFVSGNLDEIKVGKFNPNPAPDSDGKYSVTVKDLFGIEVALDYIVSESIVADNLSKVEILNSERTANPVKVTINTEGMSVYVDVTDYDIMSVEGNGTHSITVTLTSNARFSYRYIDHNGDECVFYVNVDNIIKPNVYFTYDPDPAEPATDPVTGEEFIYGEVKAYVTDENFMIIDIATGQPPIFTFIPGGPDFYTYPAGTLVARLGGEENAEEILLGETTVSLKYPLREIPELNVDVNDDVAPAIQVLAYSNQAGEWSEQKLAMQLNSRRGITPFLGYDGYKIFSYSGERANMSKLLDEMGWSTSYRFVFEIYDSSRVRLFVKDGLYAEAPAFKNGISDTIEGVELNSKLLTVSKTAKFTVFAVDSLGNVSSVAFDINNVGEAPAPTIKRVVSASGVRVYFIKPDGAEDFELLSLDMSIGIESAEGEYKGLPYVDIKENDSYQILYKMKYNGTEISPATIDVFVGELRPQEISLVGGVTWSANKLSEATSADVVAKVMFSESIVGMDALNQYDGENVVFTTAGNMLTVTYKKNSEAISVKCYSKNGSYVTVELDSVTNIDKDAPVITCEKVELAADAKSATLTIKVNERATFKEGGGLIGELIDGAYYYTRTVADNGEYTYTFTNMSGISASITIKVDSLVLEPLSVEFSNTPDGTEIFKDPAQIDLKVGDTVFVKPSRDAIMQISGGEEISVKCDVFTSVTIP